MFYAKKLLDKVNEYFLNESKLKRVEYFKMKKGERKARGNPPGKKVAFIPANSSGKQNFATFS